MLDVADGVKAEMAEVASISRYEDIDVRYIQDSSVDVRGGLSQLALPGSLARARHAHPAPVPAEVRTTLLVAVAIPLSIVTTFVIMYLGRQTGLVDTTLNVISLFGLMVAVGMLADPAIVVIDSISRHFTEYKEDSRTAAIHGASAVTMPIVAGAATTMCVFLPLVFLGATMGGFFRIFTDFGFTLSVVIVASLLVALTVVPMMAGVVLRNERRVYSRTMRLLGRLHGKIIRRTLQHRLVSLGVAIGLLGLAWILYQNIERSSFSSTVERQVTINVDVPRAYSMDETREVMESVAALIEERREELEIADVVYEFRRGGGRSRGGYGGGGRRFNLYLVDEMESERSVQEITGEIREMLPTVAGVDFRIAESRGHGPGGGSGIRLDLKGDDMDVLELISGRVVERLATLPWIRDVDTSLESGTEELHVTPLAERGARFRFRDQRGGPDRSQCIDFATGGDHRERPAGSGHRRPVPRGAARAARSPPQHAGLRGRRPGARRRDGRLRDGERPPQHRARRSPSQAHHQREHHGSGSFLPADGSGTGTARRHRVAARLRVELRPVEPYGPGGLFVSGVRLRFCAAADLPDHGGAFRELPPSGGDHVLDPVFVHRVR